MLVVATCRSARTAAGTQSRPRKAVGMAQGYGAELRALRAAVALLMVSSLGLVATVFLLRIQVVCAG